jgi:hypothetical protein
MFIYDAAMQYMAQGTPTVVFAGEEYGTGSSRDWAAKGTQLLGIKAVVARSFERIHRSNLVGMGVLPLQFKGGDSWQSLGLTGAEVIDVLPDAALTPQSDATLVIHREDGTRQQGGGHAAHRHADRSGLLPGGRHLAVRAAPAAGGLLTGPNAKTTKRKNAQTPKRPNARDPAGRWRRAAQWEDEKTVVDRGGRHWRFGSLPGCIARGVGGAAV